MPEWITWTHAVMAGLASLLAMTGFLPPVRAVVWNLVLKCSGCALAERQQLLTEVARRHLLPPAQEADPPPPTKLEAVAEPGADGKGQRDLAS